MAVITIKAYGLETEDDFFRALVEANRIARQFRESHEFETMTPEEWEEWYQIQAQAVWLEDTYNKIKGARIRSESLGKKKKRTVWEAVRGGERWED